MRRAVHHLLIASIVLPLAVFLVCLCLHGMLRLEAGRISVDVSAECVAVWRLRDPGWNAEWVVLQKSFPRLLLPLTVRSRHAYIPWWLLTAAWAPACAALWWCTRSRKVVRGFRVQPSLPPVKVSPAEAPETGQLR